MCADCAIVRASDRIMATAAVGCTVGLLGVTKQSTWRVSWREDCLGVRSQRESERVCLEHCASNHVLCLRVGR